MTYAQIIITIAGNGDWGYSGDGGPALDAKLYSPSGVVADSSGNVYFSDMVNNRVRKVTSTGLITTFAGNGYNSDSLTGGFSGDGGPADSAALYWPSGLAFDRAGNMYIADAGNSRIRKVSPAGIITTYAGTDSSGYNGDGQPATSARLHYPSGIWIDETGDLFIADCFNNRVRKIDTAGMITTVAGNGYGAGTLGGGYGGDGGPATSAQLSWPAGVATDRSGNLYIAEINNNCVRKVTPGGIISTIAGNDTVAGYNGDGMVDTLARLCAPGGLMTDTVGNLYIADAGNSRIRIITPGGIINTFAGTGYGGFSGDGGLCTDAELFSPNGMAFDLNGNMYIADEANYRVREILATPSLVKQLPLSQQVFVYPNPATDHISLTIPATVAVADIILSDLNGGLILHKTAAAHATAANMDVSNLPRGVYLLTIDTPGYSSSAKIILK